MHEAGNAQLAIAAALGVHKNTVHHWLKGWRIAGAAALKAKKRGRRHAAKRLLDAEQAAEVRQLMIGHCPDQLDLPWALWSREAVRDLVQARCGVRLALRTVSDYLRRWRFTPQRPIRRASERQEAAVQAWLAEHYPKIAARAKAEGAEIHWGDETGISNQAAYGRSFAPKGQTPVIRRTARRHTTSMISTVTNRGSLRFMLYEGASAQSGCSRRRINRCREISPSSVATMCRLSKRKRSRPPQAGQRWWTGLRTCSRSGCGHSTVLPITDLLQASRPSDQQPAGLADPVFSMAKPRHMP